MIFVTGEPSRAADTGAGARTLMAPRDMGHPAALILQQHTSRGRDEALADLLSRRIEQEKDRARNGHAAKVDVHSSIISSGSDAFRPGLS